MTRSGHKLRKAAIARAERKLPISVKRITPVATQHDGRNRAAMANLLAEKLFDKVPSTILTSATLSVEGGFDYLIKRLGIPYARTLNVASPFHFQEQALLYVPQAWVSPAPLGVEGLTSVYVSMGVTSTQHLGAAAIKP